MSLLDKLILRIESLVKRKTTSKLKMEIILKLKKRVYPNNNKVYSNKITVSCKLMQRDSKIIHIKATALIMLIITRN